MARTVSSTAPGSWVQRNAGMAVGIAVLGIIMMLFVPLPPWMLDGLIACNLALAVFTLMVSLFIRRPLDFSVFPTMLLIMTLYRLALNVVSTRLILRGGEVIKQIPQGGSLAKVAGVVISTIGDLIMGFGNKRVDDLHHLQRLMHAKNPTDQVRLKIYRRGKGFHHVNVSLKELPKTEDLPIEKDLF